MKPKNNPVLHPVTKRISCVKGIHVQVSFQIGITNSIQSAPVKRLIWRSRGPEINNQELRQKLWGKHISGSPTWACVRIPRGLAGTDVRALLQSFSISKIGWDTNTCVSHKFPRIAVTASPRATLGKPRLQLPSHTPSSPPSSFPSSRGAKNFLLAALRLAGYLLPWFSPGNNRSLNAFSSPLSNKSALYVIKQPE